jgi:hypothetical protein
MPQDRSRERNKTNKGRHSRENKRKMGMKEDVWAIACWWIINTHIDG